MKYIKIFFLLSVVAATLASCNKDELDSQSIFDTTPVERNEFDKWLLANYTAPYNISFLYRYSDMETQNAYNVIPADSAKSVAMSIMLKHVWLDAYTEVNGGDSTFLKKYSPRVLQLIGSAEYNTSGSIVVGTAEGGVKIWIFRINDIDVNNPSVDVDSPLPNKNDSPMDLNYWVFHTMHHEFCHILTQKKNYSTEFRTISNSLYHNGDWVNVEDEDALLEGFVSGYGSSEYNEDFAEVYATYVTHTKEAWDELLEMAIEKDDDGNVVSTLGKEAIQQKVDIIKEYMLNSWNMDLDKIRDVVVRRSQEVPSLDLRTLK